MTHIEVPPRLSDAIEAFKADLNGCLHTSGTLASLKECLKQHLSTGQVGSQCWRSDGSSLPNLAHCITAEYLESTQLKFTLPVFLSETCQSKQSNPAPTSQSVLEQLGISKASSFGRAFASYAPGQLHESSQGREESLLLGLLRTIELLHGNAGGKERHQTTRETSAPASSSSVLTAQGPTAEPGKQEDQQRSPAGPMQGPAVLASDHKPYRHLVCQLKAALGLIRALRMELHTGQHLSGLLLRELYRAELDQGRCETDVQPHATRAQRIASLQDTLLRQQKRVARLEREDAALLREPDQPQPAPSAGRPGLCSCADTQALGPAGECSRLDALSPANSSTACPGCLSERSQHARRTVVQQAEPLPARSGTSSSVSSSPQSRRCTEPSDCLQGGCLGSARSSSAAAAAALVPSSRASPAAWAAQADDDDQPRADGGTASARQGATEQTLPAAARADLPTPHGSFPEVEGVERGIGPGSMPTASTEKASETALCGGYLSREGAGWASWTGHSSRSSSVPLQESVEEENDAHDQVVHDGAGAESRSSLSSVQHRTHTPPASRPGPLGSAILPSGDAAALLQGASLEPATLSPAQAPQEVTPSCAGSASDEEQRPSGLGMSPPREQLPQQSEHRQSNTDAAGCSPAEPSAPAWAGHPYPAAPSPQIQHSFDGGASTTATQQAQAQSPSHCELSSQQSPARELTESYGDDLSSISRDFARPVRERASEDGAGERQGRSPEEDELSRRMRSFLARLPDDPASARGRDSAGPGSALSLQAAHGSEGMSDRGDDPGDEQAHEEGQGPSDECPTLQGPGQVQLGHGAVSRGDHDGSEPGTRCVQDVCTPAAPDAACSITIAGTGHTGTWISAAAHRVMLPVCDTPIATVSPKTALESADAGTTLSVSPAFSMLPWDKPGMWSSPQSSMHSLEPHTGSDPSTDLTGASLTASATHTAPVAFMRQLSRLSVTVAGEEEPVSPEAITSDTRPSSLGASHDSRWHMQTLDATTAQCHQHDGIISWAHLSGSTKTLWARDPSANSPGTASVAHFQQDGTAAQPDPLSDAYRGEATPASSSAGMHQEHPHLSKEAFVAELLGHMHGPLEPNHLAFPAQDDAALQGSCQVCPGEFADPAAAWERHSSRTSYNGESADAEMHSSHHWLSMHGYSDAAVHVTATLAEAVMPSSVAESDSMSTKGLSPVGEPPPVYQEYTDRLSGAMQQSFTPCSLRVSSNRREGGPAVDTGSALQTDMHHVRPGTASSGTNFAADPTVSAGGVAQERINVQGVALSRTMPSIWDLDS